MNTRQLQTLLYQHGFSPGEIDGQMGRKTIAAIKAFQTARGLKPDGVVGPLTLAALGANPAPITAPGEHLPAGQDLRVSPNCIDCIKAWEGLHDGDKKTTALEPEPDPIGIYTLGWGYALTDAHGEFITTKAGADAWMMRNYGRLSIDRDEAKALLAVTVNAFLSRIEPIIRGMPTTQAELDALVSFAYNLGARTLANSTLLTRHKNNVPVSAAFDFAALKAASQRGATAGPTEYAFAAYAFAKGKWALGLYRRRVCEAMLYGGSPIAPAIVKAQNLR